MKARWFLRKHSHLPHEELEVLFDILDIAIVRLDALYTHALRRIQQSSNTEEVEWPEFDADGLLIESVEGPADATMLEADTFETEEEAYANAREQFAKELPLLIAQERERLTAGGRRKTKIECNFHPQKDSAECRTPRKARRGTVPGAPAKNNGKTPKAGEAPMAPNRLITCDICTLIKFTPSRQSDTTCPYCSILRGRVAQDHVGNTTRAIHEFFCLLGIGVENWENDVRRLCGEAERKGSTPVAILMERVFPLWKKEYLIRARTQPLPEGLDARKYADRGWDAWKDLNAGGRLKDEDSWSLVFTDLLEEMRADADEKAASKAADQAKKKDERAERKAREAAECAREARIASELAAKRAKMESDEAEAWAEEILRAETEAYAIEDARITAARRAQEKREAAKRAKEARIAAAIARAEAEAWAEEILRAETEAWADEVARAEEVARETERAREEARAAAVQAEKIAKAEAEAWAEEVARAETEAWAEEVARAEVEAYAIEDARVIAARIAQEEREAAEMEAARLSQEQEEAAKQAAAQAAPRDLGKPRDGNPLPKRLEKIEKSESVWLSLYVNHKHKKLSREQRYQLVAIRRQRIVEIALKNRAFSAVTIGMEFHEEVPDWVKRITGRLVIPRAYPPQPLRTEPVITLINQLIEMIQGDRSKEELLSGAERIRRCVAEEPEVKQRA